MFVDVHCHLDHELYVGKVKDVVQRAGDAGVKFVVTAGTNESSNAHALELAKAHSMVLACVGAYPVDALQLGDDELATLGLSREGPCDVDKIVLFIEAHKDSIVGVGEIGLDYKRVDYKERQKKNFVKMLRVAKRLGKVVVVHSRDAEEDVLAILEREEIKKVVLHCFGGRKQLVRRGVKLGCLFSVPAVLPRSSHFQMIVKEVPLHLLLTETDGPFFSPDDARSSEPVDVVRTVQEIAKIKGVTFEEAQKMIFANFQRVFL